MNSNKAFTLSEMVIALVIIGGLLAIFLPMAKNIMPDSNVIKFKKANNALGHAVTEMVSSDLYYFKGDLGVSASGTVIDSTSANYVYFCEILADILSPKTVSCTSASASGTGSVQAYTSYPTKSNLSYSNCLKYDFFCYKKGVFGWEYDDCGCTSCKSGYELCEAVQFNGRSFMGCCLTSTTYTPVAMATVKSTFDSACAASGIPSNQIVMADGIVYYETNKSYTFGITSSSNRVFTSGKYGAYKVFCIDVDGINKGEAPFGYGIRADGKILTGTRADEWLNKSVQQTDN